MAVFSDTDRSQLAESAETLKAALRRHGITHKPSNFPGKKELFHKGKSLGHHTAHSAWKVVHKHAGTKPMGEHRWREHPATQELRHLIWTNADPGRTRDGTMVWKWATKANATKVTRAAKSILAKAKRLEGKDLDDVHKDLGQATEYLRKFARYVYHNAGDMGPARAWDYDKKDESRKAALDMVNAVQRVWRATGTLQGVKWAFAYKPYTWQNV